MFHKNPLDHQGFNHNLEVKQRSECMDKIFYHVPVKKNTLTIIKITLQSHFVFVLRCDTKSTDTRGTQSIGKQNSEAIVLKFMNYIYLTLMQFAYC